MNNKEVAKEFCKDKSNKTLIKALEDQPFTPGEGNFIVLEILKRLVNKYDVVDEEHWKSM